MTKADKEGQRKAPILRFKSFTDDWEQRKLGNLFNERKEKSTKGELLSVTLSNGVTKFSDLNKKDNSNIKSGNYKVVKKNDIPYNSMRMWQGASGVSSYDGIVSPAYTVLVPNRNSNSNFYAVLFKKKSILNLFTRFSQGLTSDTWNLKYPILKDIIVPFTNLEEQKRIFKIFNVINNLLALYERKLKLVKLIYKELENKVYNNDLIKQTNFTKVKLGEILKEKNIKSTYEDQYPVLSSTNSGIELRNGRTNSSSNIGYKVLSKNELVLSPQNLWLGNININFNFGNSLVSPSYKVFSLTNNVNIIYLNSLLHHPKMMYLYKVVSVQGASVVRRNLDIEAFKNLTLKLPSIEAQDKIGNLLDKNKQLIDNLENKKEQFSKVKTTLLNTMFI